MEKLKEVSSTSVNSPVQTDEVKKASFWVSQIFIIAATVLGVYLAANQGFKLALEFDRIQGDKNNYYLRKSLHGELSDNINFVKEYISKVKQQYDKPTLVLETFIWEAMKNSSSTLETPSFILQETQRYYRNVNDILNSSYLPISQKATKLQELTDSVEKNLLPKFEANIGELEKNLNAINIKL